MSNLMRLTKDELADIAVNAGWSGDPDDVTKADLAEFIEQTDGEDTWPVPSEPEPVEPVAVLDVPDIHADITRERADRDARVVGPARARQ